MVDFGKIKISLGCQNPKFTNSPKILGVEEIKIEKINSRPLEILVMSGDFNSCNSSRISNLDSDYFILDSDYFKFETMVSILKRDNNKWSKVLILRSIITFLHDFLIIINS